MTRLQFTVTEAAKSLVALGVLSSVHPSRRCTERTEAACHGDAGDDGIGWRRVPGAGFRQRRVLFAAFDARAGQKYTGKFDKLNTLSATEGAFDYEAEQIVQRLRKERSKGAQ